MNKSENRKQEVTYIRGLTTREFKKLAYRSVVDMYSVVRVWRVWSCTDLVNLAWRGDCHAWRWACGGHARRGAHHHGPQPRGPAPPPRAAPIARPSHMTQPAEGARSHSRPHHPAPLHALDSVPYIPTFKLLKLRREPSRV